MRMKEVKKTMVVCLLVATAALFASCVQSGTPDTGGSNSDLSSNGAQGDDSNSGSNSGSTTGSTILWSTFEGCDLQIWSGTFTSTEGSNGLEITVSAPDGWWGGCFCDSGANAAGAAVTFDMSKVASITFDAKASAAGSMWVSSSNNAAKVTGQTKIALTTDWVTQTYACAGNVSSSDYGVLDIGGGDLSTTTTAGYVIDIKNIKFLDASGAEILPTRNE